MNEISLGAHTFFPRVRPFEIRWADECARLTVFLPLLVSFQFLFAPLETNSFCAFTFNGFVNQTRSAAFQLFSH